MRTCVHTKWNPVTILTWMRGAQRAIVKFERKYASYRNRTLTSAQPGVSSRLRSPVPRSTTMTRTMIRRAAAMRAAAIVGTAVVDTTTGTRSGTAGR